MRRSESGKCSNARFADKDPHLIEYLRRRMEYPGLNRAVREHQGRRTTLSMRRSGMNHSKATNR